MCSLILLCDNCAAGFACWVDGTLGSSMKHLCIILERWISRHYLRVSPFWIHLWNTKFPKLSHWTYLNGNWLEKTSNIKFFSYLNFSSLLFYLCIERYSLLRPVMQVFDKKERRKHAAIMLTLILFECSFQLWIIYRVFSSILKVLIS